METQRVPWEPGGLAPPPAPAAARTGGSAGESADRPAGRGLLVLYTGDGKGKTSAALGALLRSRGWEMRVRMVQFIKSEGLSAGEHQAARRLGVEIAAMGRGFVRNAECGMQNAECRMPEGAAPEHAGSAPVPPAARQASHRQFAQDAWRLCREALADPECDTLILDEITYPLAYGWLPMDEVLAALRARPTHQHVILTGRQAPDALIEAADLVTEMREVKHPYRAGVPAQRGIEF